MEREEEQQRLMEEALEQKQIRPFEPMNNTRAVRYPKIFRKYNFDINDVENMPRIDDPREAMKCIVALPDEEFGELRKVNELTSQRHNESVPIEPP